MSFFPKDSVLRSVFILMTFFVLGYASLVAVHLVFANIQEQLDQQIKNEQSRYKIGEYILKEINSIETKYYQLAMVFKKPAGEALLKKINEEVDHIYHALDVLEHGGVLENYIDLNIVGLSQSVEYIKFTPEDGKKLVFESIDIRPKLASIEKVASSLVSMIDLRKKMLSAKTLKEKKKIRFKVQLFLKNIPPHFIRMKENTSRLLYESKKNVEAIEANIEAQKNRYTTLETIITFMVMMIVIFLGYIISKQIEKKRTELKEAIEKTKTSALEAKKANEAKSQFLANMSHEIRTPLNAIIGFSDLLQNSKLPQDEAEKASIISKSAKTLLNIINDILDISKVESGKSDLLIDRFNSIVLFDQIVELFSVKAKEKNILLKYKVDFSIPEFLQGDSIRIQQVLSNLLSNAIKFTPEYGKVNFNIKNISKNEEEVIVRFTIEDNGIGMSEEEQAKIFTPFTQADGSISRKYGGTGLGLSICTQIIKMMDSNIQLESTKGKGSNFYFDLTLPIDKNEESEKHQNLNYNFVLYSISFNESHISKSLQHYLNKIGNIIHLDEIYDEAKPNMLFCFDEEDILPTLEKFKSKYPDCPIVYVGNYSQTLKKLNEKNLVDFQLESPIYGSKIFNTIATACNIHENDFYKPKREVFFKGKVLVAEDNVNNQKLISILLKNLGLECDVVGTGLDAIEAFMNNSYELIFMDINMPLLDGLSATKKIRSYEKRLDDTLTPIIALTANTLKGDKERFLQNGMDDFLSKPIEHDKLVYTLKKYLKTKVSDLQLIVEEHTKSTPQETNIKNTPKIDIEKYDKNEVMKKMMLDSATIDMLLENFFLTLSSDIENLQKAIEAKDSEEIYQKAHYLKGSCANLMMKSPEKLLTKIENDAKATRSEDHDIELLKEMFNQIKEELK